MTAKFREPIQDHLQYLPTATPREAQAINALVELGSTAAAADALGISTSALHQRLVGARQRHALASEGAPPPDGFRAVKVTQRGDGSVMAVQSKPQQTQDHHDPRPEGHVVKGVSTLYGADGEIAAQWVKTNLKAVAQHEAMKGAVASLVEYVTPVLPTDAPKFVDNDLATVLPWGDPHIGLLSWAAETGESWDLKAVEEASAQVFADLISRTPRSAEFVLVDLGDLFDAEDDKQVTPASGHKLDVDSRSGKIARVAVRIFRNAIDLALQRHAKVSVHLLRGNHDPYKSLMLGLLLEALYANEPRVTVKPFENPYQFWQFGNVAAMMHHGDGSKPQQMPGVFACDPSWGPAGHRVVWTGHIHTQNRWDLPGCTVESFRTIAASNYWAHHKGYRSKRTLDCITYHRTHGEISRVQQGLMVRAPV